jgi:putative molybdopterin biosynthesis protein
VTHPPLSSTLRLHRSAAGLSQQGLAHRVGVSRQAIVAIESGRQVPSTTLALQLARALRCSVEDLFDLPEHGHIQAAVAIEGPGSGTRVALGRIDGVWAAHPLGSRVDTADGVVVGPSTRDCGRSADAATMVVDPFDDPAELEKNVLVAGCAPLLGVLTARLGRRYVDARGTWIPANSEHALLLLERGLVHIAGLHLVSFDAPGGHTAMVRSRMPELRASIVHVLRWRQGLLLAPDNPLGITSLSDLERGDVRFARRESGSGAWHLTRRLLTEKGHDPSTVAAGPLARSHAEVAALVRSGAADLGVGIESAALTEGLHFLPLAEERFDLVVPYARTGETPTGRLIDLLGHRGFRAEAASVPGYDLSDAGQAVSVGPT